MKRFLHITILLFITICCTSCFTLMTIAAIDHQNRVELGADLGKKEAFFKLTTFQKISDYAALATTGAGEVVCVIANFDNYYDGLRLSGRFVCQGTYSYVTITGVQKYVLVYVFKRDLDTLKGKVEQFLKEHGAKEEYEQ